MYQFYYDNIQTIFGHDDLKLPYMDTEFSFIVIQQKQGQCLLKWKVYKKCKFFDSSRLWNYPELLFEDIMRMY